MIFTLLIGLGFSSEILNNMRAPLVAGHRGGTTSANSYNTLEQFAAAIKQNVDILEMDLRLTSDGVVVVFHDEDLDHKTNCHGMIADLPWAQIQGCKYKGTEHKVPSFEQVVQFVNHRAIINAEFKTVSVIAATLKIVKDYNIYDWSYFQVNSEMDKYQEARRLDVRVALLYKPRTEEELAWLENIHDPNIVIAHMDKDFVTSERIQRVHTLGKLVSVNSWKWDLLEERFKSACRKVFKAGIDIAIANNTKDCVKARDEIKP